MAAKRTKPVAVVRCLGTGMRTEAPRGLDCKAAEEQRQTGFVPCEWGCLGLGSCVAACKLGAVTIGPRGAALIDRETCASCGLCVKACPRGLIALAGRESVIDPRCSSRDGGAATRKVCEVGCIACGICVKNCPADAIHLVDSHAVIDEARCIACGMCAVKCPQGTIVDADGIFTPLAEAEGRV